MNLIYLILNILNFIGNLIYTIIMVPIWTVYVSYQEIYRYYWRKNLRVGSLALYDPYNSSSILYKGTIEKMEEDGIRLKETYNRKFTKEELFPLREDNGNFI